MQRRSASTSHATSYMRFALSPVLPNGPLEARFGARLATHRETKTTCVVLKRDDLVLPWKQQRFALTRRRHITVASAREQSTRRKRLTLRRSLSCP
jgi:hypothetical protein